MINRVMTKDNIALAALLETKESVYENASNEFVSFSNFPALFFQIDFSRVFILGEAKYLTGHLSHPLGSGIL